MSFVKGLTLCEGFFLEIAKPILDKHFPELNYSAGLIGYGSDVLGYDDEVSTDHMWGPRFYLFLNHDDISKKQDIMSVFSRIFPFEYKGYSVNFSTPNSDDNGVRHPDFIRSGLVSPLIFIHTLDDYLSDYLGTADLTNLTELDWLSFSEHRLLALTSGKIFHDDLNIQKTLSLLSYYPDEVRLYLIASNWSLIAQEQAFLRRCYDVGDELGSALITSRIAERLMRLSFLYCKKYAPYSKWFGTAFSELPVSQDIKHALSCAINAANINERENYIVSAQKKIAELHNKPGLTEVIDVQIESYYGRNIKVIFADKIVYAVMEKLSGTKFEHFPLIGTLSGVANFTNISDPPKYRAFIKKLYGN